jgi:predicted GNAT family acetyltransferase
METIGEVTIDGQPHAVVKNDDADRFEIRIGEYAALLAFHIRGTVLSLNHTEVPSALRGKGLADALARTALEYAQSHRLTVNPYCPFVAKFIQRHQEYQALVAAGFKQ